MCDAQVTSTQELSETGEDGANTLSLVNAAYLSDWQGHKVTLPLDNETYSQLLRKKIEEEKKN